MCLALEVIENHAYDRSRFLRGAVVDESRIEREPPVEAQAPGLKAEAAQLRWLGEGSTRFELLDKPVVFDDAQEGALRHPAPLVLIGSAGSGKTAVTISRLREIPGRVLYVTLSAYLAQSARNLYAAHGFENPEQEVDFLSFRELLETLRVPAGREVTLPAFGAWCQRQRPALRALGELDEHALFEEFRGVIGAQPDGPLSLADYLALGSRQRLVAPAQREAAHALYQRYRAWLGEAGLFDTNLVAHDWRKTLVEPSGETSRVYDFVVVDEVQDLTPVQLALVLALLKQAGKFILCGDSHQIVHPNFFSWSALKSLFWRGLAGEAAQRQPLQLLQANFRNTRAVTSLANSVHEAKGLEYPHVLLLNLVSGHRQAYAEVCDGVTDADLQGDSLEYRRARNKADKALELYKFHVNALYVAMTRAVQTLTLVEQDPAHPLFGLLGLRVGHAQAQAVAKSSVDEWAQEARKLELQGKAEQAQAIRDAFLQHKPVPWTPWSRALVEDLAPKALDARNPSSKLRQTLFDYAMWHGQHEWVAALAGVNFAPARTMVKDGHFWAAGTLLPRRNPEWDPPAWAACDALTRRTFAAARQRHLQPWQVRSFKELLRLADVHGPDHATPCGATPLMMAARAGNAPLVQALLDKGVRPAATRRVRPLRLGSCGQPRHAGDRVCSHGAASGLRIPDAGRPGRADRRPTRPPGTAPGRILGADADAGRPEDAVVGLRDPTARALPLRRRLLRRPAARRPGGTARLAVARETAQAHLSQPGAGACRGLRVLPSRALPVGAHAQRPLPAEPRDAAARGRAMAARVPGACTGLGGQGLRAAERRDAPTGRDRRHGPTATASGPVGNGRYGCTGGDATHHPTPRHRPLSPPGSRFTARSLTPPLNGKAHLMPSA